MLVSGRLDHGAKMPASSSPRIIRSWCRKLPER